MPYEIVTLFHRCSDLHGSHKTFTEAAACFTELTRRYNGNIPVHPVSQKYVFAIAAIDRKGNQRNYSNSDKNQAKTLGIDPKAQLIEIPTITTFTHVARMYHEALKLFPISGINLSDIFDYTDRRRHFWTTDAGIGQALAYAQQSVFTLELCFKAYLEVLGKLASTDAADVQKWQTHELVDLYKLMSSDEMMELERSWHHSYAKRNHFNGTFQEFVNECKKLYGKWRYITDLKFSNVSIDIPMLLSVSEFLIEAGHRQFRQRSPVKITFNEITSANDEDGRESRRPTHGLVEGVVRSVRIHPGFDPFDLVEVVIASDEYDEEVTAHFHKRNVKQYSGLEGKEVELSGFIESERPYILTNPEHFDPYRVTPTYETENLTLKGIIYDFKPLRYPNVGDVKFNLVLFDETYFTHVQCFFSTDEERAHVNGLKLGDRILISGLVTRCEGVPMILVDPRDLEVDGDEGGNARDKGT